MGDIQARAALLHPVALAALAILLVNDHVLKAAWPGWWTGKLSDLAALIVGPIAVAAVWQGVARRLPDTRPDWVPRRVSAEGAIALGFGVSFAAVKIDPTANHGYAVAVGLLGWPLGIAGDVLASRPIQALGLAPTVRDPTDLIALPAVALGWWLGRGAIALAADRPVIPRPAARLGRFAVLGAAWFALAATSQAAPMSRTAVAEDAISAAPGGAPVERLATVYVSAAPASGTSSSEGGQSIRIQARPRWPFNEPPATFTLTIEGGATSSGLAPVVGVPPERCAASCTLAASVAIAWPGDGGSDASSVAWELVATSEILNGYQTGYGAPGVRVDGTAFAPGNGGSVAWIWLVLILLPTAGYLAGVGPFRSRVDIVAPPGSSARRAIDTVVTAGTAAESALLVWSAAIARVGGHGSPVASSEASLVILALAAAAGLCGGVIAWLRGSGATLTATAIATAIVALPTAGIIVGAASPSFAARGIQLAIGVAILLGIILAAGPTRRRPEHVDLTDSRLFVVAVQLAVAGVLVVASPGSQLLAAFGAVVVIGLAVGTWWDGSGWLLGVVSLAVGGLAAMAFAMGGPGLFGGASWTATDRLVQVGLMAGSGIGLLASLGWVAKPPKQTPWRPTDAVIAALDPNANGTAAEASGAPAPSPPPTGERDDR